MHNLEEGKMALGMVELTRARSSGAPVRTHVVEQRRSIEINYETIRRMLHNDENHLRGANERSEPDQK